MAWVRRYIAALFVFFVSAGNAGAAVLPALVPAPERLASMRCAGDGFALARVLRFAPDVDAAGFALVRERWSKLGIPAPVRGRPADVQTVTTRAPVAARSGEGSYTLDVTARTVTLRGTNSERAFDALATLAQLPVRRGSGWQLPCVAIVDRPALRWRVVSDDLSRGPFPTMRYFKERIRTLASLKINGWSPYMEQVFADPAHPFVATPNVITAAMLRELTRYARAFHVTLIPEQQTFAHMHESLKYEELAGLAELPHGYLLAPGDPGTYAYLEPLVRAELAAARPPFFHLGADEPIDLGRGRTPRTPAVFADHVRRLARIVTAGGARPMIWDDALQQTPAILGLLPKSTIVVSFHYGAEPSFAPYLAPVARAGFDQFIAPGAANWNEIYPDLTTAYANAAQFTADGKAARVLGMFDTVWHDDGESLFEATWPAVAFAAAGAWQSQPVERTTWHTTFARAFFGTDDDGYARDLDLLQAMRDGLRTPPASDPPDYLFWSDPFDERIADRVASLDASGLRRHAESVLAHLAVARPPLHPAAADVMALAALRYDTLGRRFQIGREARAYYADARAHVARHEDGPVYRGLNVAKYLCWELRDEMTALEPLYARAWRYESTPPGLARAIVRYHLAAERAVADADRLNAAAREDYLRGHDLPPFDTVMARPR